MKGRSFLGRWRVWRWRRRVDHAMAAFAATTAHLSDDEINAEIDAIIREVRAERRVRFASSASVTEQDVSV